MGAMKDLDRRIRQGGDDAIAAVGELMSPEPEPVAYALRPPLGMNMGRGWIFYWDKREAEAAARVNPAWELLSLYSKPPG